MIEVNLEFYEIVVVGVYVIGDCIGGVMLVYKVFEEGVVCVEKIVIGFGGVYYGVIFGIVYIYFEIVIVGKIEE